jgi:anti-sigma-K factor RskA
MASTPVDDHTEEFEQLAGLSALDILEADEQQRFEHHAAQCDRCQLIVRLDREVLAQLPLTADPMDPSPDFKERLMRRAAAELEERPETAPSPAPEPTPPGAPEPTPLRAPEPVVPLWRRHPWASALAAILVIGLLTVGAFTFQNQPVATIQLHGDAPGTATVTVRRNGTAELAMQGVPDPGPGYVYEAWVIPSAPGSQPIAAGVVSNGNTTVPLEHDPRGGTVAITREHGRSETPTLPILMSGSVQS